MDGFFENRKVKNQALGKQSVRFANPVYCINSASVVGTKEGEGPLSTHYDYIMKDAEWGEKSWEKTESKMQKYTKKPMQQPIQP